MISYPQRIQKIHLFSNAEYVITCHGLVPWQMFVTRDSMPFDLWIGTPPQSGCNFGQRNYPGIDIKYHSQKVFFVTSSQRPNLYSDAANHLHPKRS